MKLYLVVDGKDKEAVIANLKVLLDEEFKSHYVDNATGHIFNSDDECIQYDYQIEDSDGLPHLSDLWELRDNV